MRADRAQVLAFRLAAHDLAERLDSPQAAAASWAIQDSPPGSAQLALHARVAGLDPAALPHGLEERSLLLTYNARTATALLPAEEAASFNGGLLPPDEKAMHDLVAGALEASDRPALEAVALVSEAVSEALDGRQLGRDELHAALRERLPKDLLPWCPGCQSHHVRRWLLVAVSLRGELCVAGRSGRQPSFARTTQWLGAAYRPVDAEAAGSEVVRRFVHRYGPTTPDLLRRWTGLGRGHARRLWSLVEAELRPVEREGSPAAWLLEDDLPLLVAPPAARGVRLLPPGDPLLQAHDRDVLIEDQHRHRDVWRPIGGPGVVLAEGRPQGVWRARKRGKRLGLTVEGFGRLSKAVRGGIETEAEAVAAHRGCAAAEVEFAV